jgi:hypothetical protein
VRGRKDLVWIDRRGVAHGLREYERWADKVTRSGTTWCGVGLNLSWQELRRLPATCMTCVVNAARG